MLAMDQIHDIRNDYYVQGLNISEIANKRNLAWRTVQKYIDMTDFNDPDPMPKEKALCPKLEPYKAKIDDWLVADKAEPRKQRHTATRVYNRLKEEVPGFNCSVRTVSAYVSARKKELGSCKKYDVVKYKRNGQYILHRVLRVLPSGYLIAGDNNFFVERDIKDADILGVMKRVIRNGKNITMDDPLYRIYVHLWCDCYPLRMFLLRGKAFLSRRLRKKILPQSR